MSLYYLRTFRAVRVIESLFPLGLWAILWFSLLGSFTVSLSSILQPSEPWAFVHALGKALPFFAGYLAMIIILSKLARHQPRGFSFFGPIGLTTVYGLVGLVSAFLSPDRVMSFYGAAAYLSVPLVLWAVVWGAEALERVRRLLDFTWIILVVAALGLAAYAFLYLDFASALSHPSELLTCKPLSTSWFVQTDRLLRSTGVGRYAALAGIIAVGGLWQGKWRFAWIPVLFISLALLLTTGARTSMVAFTVSAPLMMMLLSGKKLVGLGIIAVVVIAPVFWVTGIHDEILYGCLFTGWSRTPQPVPQEFLVTPQLTPQLSASESVAESVPEATTKLSQESTKVDSSPDQSASSLQQKHVGISVQGQNGAGSPNPQQNYPPQPVVPDGAAPTIPINQSPADSDEKPDIASPLPPGTPSESQDAQTPQPIASPEMQPAKVTAAAPSAQQAPVAAGTPSQAEIKTGGVPTGDGRILGIIPDDFFTLTGRTLVWADGFNLFAQSPVLGYGFHADRLKLGAHMHNSVIHALVQTGLAGTIPFLTGIVFGWVLLTRALRNLSNFSKKHRIVIVQAAGMLTFFTVRSIAESSGAFFGVDWLILSVVLLYIQLVNNSEVRGEP